MTEKQIAELRNTLAASGLVVLKREEAKAALYALRSLAAYASTEEYENARRLMTVMLEALSEKV